MRADTAVSPCSEYQERSSLSRDRFDRARFQRDLDGPCLSCFEFGGRSPVVASLHRLSMVLQSDRRSDVRHPRRRCIGLAHRRRSQSRCVVCCCVPFVCCLVEFNPELFWPFLILFAYRFYHHRFATATAVFCSRVGYHLVFIVINSLSLFLSC